MPDLTPPTVIFTPSLPDALPISDYWAPTNWFSLDNGDTDLGGSGPILVDVPGATPSESGEANAGPHATHRDLHSFPTRRSSDLRLLGADQLVLARQRRHRSRRLGADSGRRPGSDAVGERRGQCRTSRHPP